MNAKSIPAPWTRGAFLATLRRICRAGTSQSAQLLRKLFADRDKDEAPVPPSEWIWEKLRRVRFAFLLVAVSVPLIVVMRSHVLRDWFETHHPAMAARQLLKVREPGTQDVALLERACALVPDQPDLLRGLGRAAAVSDPALARRCYDRIEELGGTFPEDAAQHAQILLRMQDATGARAALLRADGQGASSGAVLQARLAAGVYGTPVEFNAALDALRAHGEAADVNLLLDATAGVVASVDASMADRVEHEVLAVVADECARGHVPDASGVVRMLALPLRDAANRATAAKAIAMSASLTVDQRVSAICLSFPVHPTAVEQEQIRSLCDRVIAQCGGLSAVRKGAVAAALGRHGAHAIVISLISAAEGSLDEALFGYRQDALLQLGMWREALGEAQCASGVKAQPLSSLYASLGALTNLSYGTAISTEVLRSALQDARTAKSPGACFALACAAMNFRQPKVASEALGRALACSPTPGLLEDAFVRAARRDGASAKGVLAIMEKTPGAGRDEMGLQQMDYLRLLAGLHLDAVRGDIGAAETDEAYVRFLRAFLLYRAGDYAGAADLLVPLPAFRWHQGEAAVIAGILAAAWQRDHFRTLTERIDPARLFPEERDMLDPWLDPASTPAHLLSLSGK